MLQDLLHNSSLEDLINGINDLSPEELNELLETLTGDEALGPVLDAVQDILAALNAGGDPTEIANALQNLLGGGTDGTGTPLDTLLNLGELLGGGGIGGGGGTPAPGETTGLITTLDGTLQNLLGENGGNTAITEPIQQLVNTLINPTDGALAALTGPIDQITQSEEALGVLNDLVTALAGQNDGALDPLLDGLNGVLSLGGALGNLPTGTDAPSLDTALEALNQIPGLGPVLSGILGGLAP